MEFSNRGKVVFVVGATVILFTVTMLYFLVFNKDYERVFTELSPEQLSQVTTSLENAGLRFQYPEVGGGILIEKSRLAQARNQLSKDQVFQTQIEGLEIFGEAQHAMSDFYQRINFQRALQGELERSILTIEGIESARVHLAIPREKSFSRKTTDVKAAVTIAIDESQTVNIRSMVATIKQLVSSSVIDLKPENVSVLDSSSRLLGDGHTQGSEGAMTLKLEIETSIEQKIRQLLSPYYNVLDIGISSWATVNNNQVTETSEGYDASVDPVVIKRVTETTEKSKKKPTSTVLNEEYSYTSVTRAVDYQKGTLERLTVSVLVPESDHLELNTLRRLVSSAIGIDVSRGDELTVAFVPVVQSSPLPVVPSESEVNIIPKQAQQPSVEQWSPQNQTDKSVNFSLVALCIFTAMFLVHLVWWRRKHRVSAAEEKQIMKDVTLWIEEKRVEQNVKL